MKNTGDNMDSEYIRKRRDNPAYIDSECMGKRGDNPVYIEVSI